MVVDDTLKAWEMEGQKGVSRVLTLIDQDQGHRMIPSFQCKIEVNGSVQGDGQQGATLKDCLIELAVTDINQREFNKRLMFTGTVTKVVGRMQMVPFNGAPAPEKKAA